MRSWIKIIGSALTVAFVAAGLYTIFVNFTTTGDPEGDPSDAALANPHARWTNRGYSGCHFNQCLGIGSRDTRW
jgi:hypothetical protein